MNLNVWLYGTMPPWTRKTVRPAQLPKPTWRCWLHPCPSAASAVFVYDIDRYLPNGGHEMAGALCVCGAFRYPTEEYVARGFRRVKSLFF